MTLPYMPDTPFVPLTGPAALGKNVLSPVPEGSVPSASKTADMVIQRVDQGASRVWTPPPGVPSPFADQGSSSLNTPTPEGMEAINASVETPTDWGDVAKGALTGSTSSAAGMFVGGALATGMAAATAPVSVPVIAAASIAAAIGTSFGVSELAHLMGVTPTTETGKMVELGTSVVAGAPWRSAFKAAAGPISTTFADVAESTMSTGTGRASKVFNWTNAALGNTIDGIINTAKETNIYKFGAEQLAWGGTAVGARVIADKTFEKDEHLKKMSFELATMMTIGGINNNVSTGVSKLFKGVKTMFNEATGRAVSPEIAIRLARVHVPTFDQLSPSQQAAIVAKMHGQASRMIGLLSDIANLVSESPEQVMNALKNAKTVLPAFGELANAVSSGGNTIIESIRILKKAGFTDVSDQVISELKTGLDTIHVIHEASVVILGKEASDSTIHVAEINAKMVVNALMEDFTQSVVEANSVLASSPNRTVSAIGRDIKKSLMEIVKATAKLEKTFWNKVTPEVMNRKAATSNMVTTLRELDTMVDPGRENFSVRVAVGIERWLEEAGTTTKEATTLNKLLKKQKSETLTQAESDELSMLKEISSNTSDTEKTLLDELRVKSREGTLSSMGAKQLEKLQGRNLTLDQLEVYNTLMEKLKESGLTLSQTEKLQELMGRAPTINDIQNFRSGQLDEGRRLLSGMAPDRKQAAIHFRMAEAAANDIAAAGETLGGMFESYENAMAFTRARAEAFGKQVRKLTSETEYGASSYAPEETVQILTSTSEEATQAHLQELTDASRFLMNAEVTQPYLASHPKVLKAIADRAKNMVSLQTDLVRFLVSKNMKPNADGVMVLDIPAAVEFMNNNVELLAQFPEVANQLRMVKDNAVRSRDFTSAVERYLKKGDTSDVGEIRRILENNPLSDPGEYMNAIKSIDRLSGVDRRAVSFEAVFGRSQEAVGKALLSDSAGVEKGLKTYLDFIGNQDGKGVSIIENAKEGLHTAILRQVINDSGGDKMPDFNKLEQMLFSPSKNDPNGKSLVDILVSTGFQKQDWIAEMKSTIESGKTINELLVNVEKATTSTLPVNIEHIYAKKAFTVAGLMGYGALNIHHAPLAIPAIVSNLLSGPVFETLFKTANIRDAAELMATMMTRDPKLLPELFGLANSKVQEDVVFAVKHLTMFLMAEGLLRTSMLNIDQMGAEHK